MDNKSGSKETGAVARAGGGGKETGAGAAGAGGGNSNGGGTNKGGNNDLMKDPGGNGAYISRTGFENNPKGGAGGSGDDNYKETGAVARAGGGGKETGAGAAGADGGTNKGGNNDLIIKAPGGDGAYISRTGFENDPKGYFSELHPKEKASK
nr:circumsporozoite protein-like [Coffea arabica]